MMRRVTPFDIPTNDRAQGVWLPLRHIFARNAEGLIYPDPDDVCTQKRVRAWFGVTTQPLPWVLKGRETRRTR